MVNKKLTIKPMELNICSVMALIFITLKLIGVIKWSWIWVLAPLWIGIIVIVIMFLFLLIISGITNKRI